MGRCLKSYFQPHQLGVGSSGECEAAIHAARRYLESLLPDHVVVKLDFANAFNTLHRYDMLQAIHEGSLTYICTVFQLTVNLHFCTTEMTLFFPKKEPSRVILLDHCFFKYYSASAESSFVQLAIGIFG